MEEIFKDGERNRDWPSCGHGLLERLLVSLSEGDVTVGVGSKVLWIQ